MHDNVPEIARMEEIHELEVRYAREMGTSPIDLSNANLSSELAHRMRAALQLPPFPDLVDYIYSHATEEANHVLQRLGIDDDSVSLRTTPARGTAAIKTVHSRTMHSLTYFQTRKPPRP